MKFCEHCGNEVLDDAVICPKCGCSVSYNQPVKGQSAAPNGSAPRVDSYSALSIVGFIFALFGGIIGLILCIMAKNEARNTGSQKSLSLANAGFIISIISLVLEVLAVVVLIIALIIGVAVAPIA